MWELIQANKRRSTFLLICMGLCFILLGYLIGIVAFPDIDGWIIGIFIALLIWLILFMISYFSGSSIILAMSRAREVSRDIHPQLFNIVEEMKISAGCKR